MNTPEALQSRPTRSGPIGPSAAGAEQLDKLKELSGGDWMHPGKVLLASIVISVVVGLILYYTTTLFLTVGEKTADAPNIFSEANWVTVGGGALFMLLVAVLIALCGASIGMSWKNNGNSTIWSMGTSAFIGIIYYFVFVSAKEGRKDQFGFWTFLSSVVAIGISGYGWWQMRKLANHSKEGGAEDQIQLSKRASWSTGIFGGTIILTIVVAAGLWKIHGALKSPIE